MICKHDMVMPCYLCVEEKNAPIMKTDKAIRRMAGKALKKDLEGHMRSFVKGNEALLQEVNPKRYDQWKDGLIGNDELVSGAIDDLLSDSLPIRI